MPSNFLWEDLYNASPNAKVILTIRDSEEQWKESYITFLTKLCSSTYGIGVGNPWFWIFSKFEDNKLLGPKYALMKELSKFKVSSYLSVTQVVAYRIPIAKIMPGFDPKTRCFTWQGYFEHFAKVRVSKIWC